MPINYSKFAPGSATKEKTATTTRKINFSKFVPASEKKKVTVQQLTTKKEDKKPLNTEKIFTLPAQLGGGQYKSSGPGTNPKTERSQDALRSKEGYERDHKVPVSLGGTSSKDNLQYLAPKKRSIFKKVGDFLTGKSEDSPEIRQQGKVALEQQLARDVEKNRVSVPEARSRVMVKNQEIQKINGVDGKKKPWEFLIPELKETFIDPIKEGVQETAKFIKGESDVNKAIKDKFIPEKKKPMVFKVGEGLPGNESKKPEGRVVRSGPTIDSKQGISGIAEAKKTGEKVFVRDEPEEISAKAIASAVTKKPVGRIKLNEVVDGTISGIAVRNQEKRDREGEVIRLASERKLLKGFGETKDEKDWSEEDRAIAAEANKLVASKVMDFGGTAGTLESAASKFAKISRLTDQAAIARELKTFVPATDDVIEKMSAKLSGLQKFSEVKQVIEEMAPSMKSRPFTLKNIKASPQIKEMAEKSKPVMHPGSQRTVAAFEQSGNHAEVTKIGDTKFEIGDFGRKRIETKAGQPDRFDAAELKDTLDNAKSVHRANTDPENYRSGNKAWVAEMPNGEKRVVYTRPNKNGAEEIINWHKVDEIKNPNYLSTLESFGSPAGTRTQMIAVETRQPVRLTDRASSNIAQNGDNVKIAGDSAMPKRLTLRDISKRIQASKMAAPAAAGEEVAQGGVKKGMGWLKANLGNKELLGIRRRLNPVRFQEPETQEIFKNWYKSKAIARERANSEIGNLPREGKTGLKSIIAYEKGIPTDNAPKIRQEFDRLHQQATDAGLEVNYRENYLPHVYSNSEKEVKEAVAKYMKDKGVDELTIKSYLSGVETLPEEVSNRLKINPGFIKERVFPDYETAIKYGLSPKYFEPAQLLGHYRNELETTIANKNLIDELRGRGKIKDNHSLTRNDRGWKAIELPFSPKGYYAEPKLADMLNDLFRNEEALGPLQKGAKKIGAISKGMQSFVLSAGLPKSSFNFLSIGQLVKEVTAGRAKAIIPFIRSNSIKKTAEWFIKNEGVLKSMAEEGIDLSGRIGNFETVYKTFSSTPGLKAKIGLGWSKVFDEKTFASYIPQLQVQLFKDVQAKALRKGMDEAAARAFAGDTVKAFYGLNQMSGRGKTAEDTLSAVFFAPKFREGIINTLLNTGKSVTTQIGNPAFAYNRRLLAGMTISFGLYNVLNKKLTGHYMWDNPPGKEFELMIPKENGEVIYIAFMPSFMALPRNLGSAAIALNPFQKGGSDLETGANKIGQNTSMPIKLASDLISNKDYFGKAITKETDSGPEKLKKRAAYALLSVNHPYIRETYNFFAKDQPLYQTILKAIEFPAKYSTMDKIEQQQLYEAEEKRKMANRKRTDDFRPTYEEIEKLYDDGKIIEAKAMLNSLSDDDYAVYKKIKQQDKAEQTKQYQKDIYDIAVQIRDLDRQGRTEEANQLYATIPKDHLHAYDLLKKKLSPQ